MLLSISLFASSPPSNDVLHDTAFQFIVIAIVTLIAAIIGSIISYLFSQKQRNRKVISYEVTSDAPIASINKEVVDRVEIRFDGKPVKDMSLLVLKVWNSGNVAVKPDDFVEPIQFKFEGRTVINLDLLDTEPKDLIDQKDLGTFLAIEPIASINDIGSIEAKVYAQDPPHAVKFPKILLNPRESISIKVLLIGFKSNVNARARIADGQLLKSSSKGEKEKEIDNSIRISVIMPWLIAYIILVIISFSFFHYILNGSSGLSIINSNTCALFLLGIYYFSRANIKELLRRKIKW